MPTPHIARGLLRKYQSKPIRLFTISEFFYGESQPVAMKRDQGLSYPQPASLLDVYYMRAGLKSDSSMHQAALMTRSKTSYTAGDEPPWDLINTEQRASASGGHLTLEVN